MGGLLSGFAGGTIGGAVVSLYLDAKQYQEGMLKAEEQGKSFGTSMGNAFSKLGIVGTAAFVALGTYAIKFAVSSVHAAEAFNESVLKLTNSVENSTTVAHDSTQQWIDLASSVSDTTGVYKDQIISAEALNIQQGLTADQVKTLTPLIVDLSQKMGIDLTAAAKSVGKAVEGNSGALGKLGITIDKTAFATDHYGATLKGLEPVAGYAAKLADEKPWMKLNNALHNVAITVGEVLLRGLKDAATALAAWGPHIAQAIKLLAALGLALLFNSVGGVTGIAMSFVKIGTAVMGLNPLILAAVGTLALLTAGFMESQQEQQQFEAGVASLTQEMEHGTASWTSYNAAFEQSLKAAGGAGPVADQLRQKMKAMWTQAKTAADAYFKAQREHNLEAWAKRQEEVLTTFGHMTHKDLNQWKKDWNTAAHDVIFDLSNTTRNFGMTQKAFIQGSKAMEARAKLWADAMKKLASAKEDWVPAGYLQFLQTQGPGAITAFAGLNASKQRQMVGDWKTTTGQFDKAKGSLDNITAAVSQLPAGKQVDINVRYNYMGYDASKPFQTAG